MDITPTILDMAGVSHPSEYKGRKIIPVQGISMRPYLEGKRHYVRTDDSYLGWELLGRRALRQGKWKCVWIAQPDGASDWRLYDLSKDPGETIDLSQKYPLKTMEMIGLWDKYAKDNNVILPN